MLSPNVIITFGRHLKAQVFHLLPLRGDTGAVLRADLTDLRLVHSSPSAPSCAPSCSTRRSDRARPHAVLQHAGLFTFLFSGQFNPQTVPSWVQRRFLGTQDLELQRTDRTVFFKVGYAWVR